MENKELYLFCKALKDITNDLPNDRGFIDKEVEEERSKLRLKQYIGILKRECDVLGVNKSIDNFFKNISEDEVLNAVDNKFKQDLRTELNAMENEIVSLRKKFAFCYAKMR